jgi:hypothetical protein
MKSLFTLTPLKDLLPSLSFRTPQQQLSYWTLQKKKRAAVQKLIQFFGRKITTAHAGQLLARKITHQDLEQWRTTASTAKKFIDILT